MYINQRQPGLACWRPWRHEITVRPSDPDQRAGGAAGRPGGRRRVRQQIREEAPEVEVDRDRGGPAGRRPSWSRSPARRCSPTGGPAVITDLASAAGRAVPGRHRAGRARRRPIWRWSWCTAAGRRARALLDKLKAAGARSSTARRSRPGSCRSSSRRRPSSWVPPIEPGAAQALVDAVGHDLRALAAAVRQLVADSEGGPADRGPGPPLLRRPVGGDQLRGGRRRPGRSDRAGDGAAALGAVDRRRPGAGHQRAGRRRTRAWASWSPPAVGCGRPTWRGRSACRRGS